MLTLYDSVNAMGRELYTALLFNLSIKGFNWNRFKLHLHVVS